MAIAGIVDPVKAVEIETTEVVDVMGTEDEEVVVLTTETKVVEERAATKAAVDRAISLVVAVDEIVGGLKVGMILWQVELLKVIM